MRDDRRRIVTALRNAIRDQIKPLRAGRESHVHHEGLSFKEIVDQFLVEEGLTLEEIRVADSKCQLANVQLKKRWQLYHKQMACLNRISKEEHKRIHK